MHRILEGKPEKTKQFDRLTRRWKDDIANNLKRSGWKGVDLNNLP